MGNNPVVDYRTRLLEQLMKSADAFCAACRAAKDPYRPLEKDHWNIHRLAQHVRDVNAQSHAPRIQRTLTEHYPSFPKFDADQWAVQHDNADEPLEKILAEFENSIHATVEQLKTQPDDAWSRLGRHEIQGDRTLQIWVERSLEHIQEHLEIVMAG
jgi:hypothetical protein